MKRARRVVDPVAAKRRNVKIGFFTLLVIGILTTWGFTKDNPFNDPYSIRAAFSNVNDLKPRSPVRIAGVNVGKVTAVEPMPGSRNGAIVTMEITKSGLPIHADATAKVRPRIFLEGNWFVDLKPGSPSAPTMDEDDTIPVNQTSAPVQLGQVLTALQKDTREELQAVFQELGEGLSGEGGRGYNRSIKYWTGAFRDSAIVNDATRGVFEHDLSNYLKHTGTVARALDRDPAALKGLITDFATVADAFADEQDSLRRAIELLPQALGQARTTLGAVNEALPPLRRLARDLLPAARTSGPALTAQLPLVRQMRGLLSPSEVGGLARDLRAVVPDLVELNRGGVKLQEQTRLLSSCQLNVVQPTANDEIVDPNFKSAGKVYQEGVKWFGGIAGESRSFDANGQYVKTTAKGGANFVYQAPGGKFFLTAKPIEGVNPAPRTKESPMRPDVPCETQEPPDLRSNPAPPPSTQRKIRTNGPGYDARLAKAQDRAVDWLKGQLKREGLDKVLSVSEKPATSVAGGGGR